MTNPFRLLFIFLVCLQISACRLARVGNEDPNAPAGSPSAADASPIIQPQRNDTQGLAQVIPVEFDTSHKLKGSVHLRLDYMSPAKPDGVVATSCYESIAGHLVIGRIVCSEPSTLGMDVLAKQVDQICYIKSSSPQVAAKEPIIFQGCDNAGTLQIFKFNPELKVEVIK